MSHLELIVSISRNGLLKSCLRFFYRAKVDKKEANDSKSFQNGAFLHDMGEKSTLVDFFPLSVYFSIEILSRTI